MNKGFNGWNPNGLPHSAIRDAIAQKESQMYKDICKSLEQALKKEGQAKNTTMSMPLPNPYFPISVQYGLNPSSIFMDEYASFFKGGKDEMPKSPTKLLERMGVKEVIFNDNATIVILTTGEKGVAKKSKDDTFDPIIGFSAAYAIAEGTQGNKTQFKKLVNKMYAKSMKKKHG